MANTFIKPFYLFAPIERVDEAERIVEGYAFINEVVDGEGGLCLSRAAMEEATPDYMKWGALREMHQPSAAGTTTEIKWDAKGALIRTKIVDDAAWKKVVERVYKGFSVGVKGLIMRGKTVSSCQWIEISLVDRPKDTGALITMFRAEGSPGVDETAEIEVVEEPPLAEVADGAPVEVPVEVVETAPDPEPERAAVGDMVRIEGAETPYPVTALTETGVVVQVGEDMHRVAAFDKVTIDRTITSGEAPTRQNLEGPKPTKTAPGETNDPPRDGRKVRAVVRYSHGDPKCLHTSMDDAYSCAEEGGAGAGKEDDDEAEEDKRIADAGLTRVMVPEAPTEPEVAPAPFERSETPDIERGDWVTINGTHVMVGDGQSSGGSGDTSERDNHRAVHAALEKINARHVMTSKDDKGKIHHHYALSGKENENGHAAYLAGRDAVEKSPANKNHSLAYPILDKNHPDRYNPDAGPKLSGFSTEGFDKNLKSSAKHEYHFHAPDSPVNRCDVTDMNAIAKLASEFNNMNLPVERAETISRLETELTTARAETAEWRKKYEDSPRPVKAQAFAVTRSFAVNDEGTTDGGIVQELRAEYDALAQSTEKLPQHEAETQVRRMIALQGQLRGYGVNI